MKKKSKRYKKIKENLKTKKIDGLNQVIKEIKNNSNAKFTESIDVSFKINLKKTKEADSTIRNLIELPHGNGKKIKIAVLCDENKVDTAKKAGADIAGSEDLIKKISDKKIDFDKLICTPSMMPKIAKLGKILGPKGLMPNPKLGSVTNDVKKAITDAKSGQVEIRNDKDGNIGVSIGNKSFSDDKLIMNFNAIIDALEKYGELAKKNQR